MAIRDKTKSVYLTRAEAETAMHILRTIAGYSETQDAAIASLAECLDGLLNGFDSIVIGDPYADLPKEQRP